MNVDLGKPCGQTRDRDVDMSFPHFDPVLTENCQASYPQAFFSIYKSLSRLIGFPRYYYYHCYLNSIERV